MDNLEEKLKILSRKETSIMTFVYGKLISDIYTKKFEFQRVEDYWEITLDNEIDTLYIDDGTFIDIDINGLMRIHY